MLISLVAQRTQLSTAAVVVTAGLSCLVVKYLWKAYQLGDLPSPQASSFLFGHLFDTLGSIANWKIEGTYPEPFLRWVKQYGGAIRLREFLTPVVLLTDPKAVQHVLVTNVGNYPRNPTMQAYFADLTYGPGVLSVNGSQHEAFRKLLNPVFGIAQIKKFIGIFEAKAEKYCKGALKSACMENKTVDMASLFHELTLEVIGLTAFGFNFEESPEVHQAYEQYTVKLNPLLMIGILTIPGFAKLPLPQFERRRAAQKILKQVMMKIIDHKQSLPTNTESKDLLDLILPHATTKEALIHTTTIISGGHRTTAAALTWVFATLAKNPASVHRIREEYQAVMKKHGSLASWEAVSELKYTQAVLNETLRMTTIAPMLIRFIAQQNDVVPMANGSSFNMPSGAVVDVNLAAMNRNPKYWTKPDEFIPERFMEGTLEYEADLTLRDGKSPTFFSLTFSAGTKNCVGMKFAIAEIQIVVATMIGHFDFQLLDSSDLRPSHNGVTLQPSKLEMKLSQAAM